MRARVGAMPQPKGSQPHQYEGRGSNNRAHRVQSGGGGGGMSMQGLKRQTAHRHHDESSANNNGPGPVVGATVAEHQTSNIMHYQAQHSPHHPSGGRPFPREPASAAGPSLHFGGGGLGGIAPPQGSYPSHNNPRGQQHGGGGGRGTTEYAPVPSSSSYGVVPAGYDIPANYSNESTTRNYTDSQLGVGGTSSGGGGGGGGQGAAAPQLDVRPSSGPPPPPPPPYVRPSPSHQSLQQQQQSHPPQPLAQQYSTPRMPRHATVLKDRGSAENSVGSSDPSAGSHDGMMGYGGGGYGGGHYRGSRGGHHASKTSPPSSKGRGGGSHGKNLNKADNKQASSSSSGRTPLPKEMRSPSDGRRTPVRDRNNFEGQVLFATPNRRRDVPSTPAVVYSEPPMRSRTGNYHHRAHHQNMSPNYNRMRSPDHHAGAYTKGGNGCGAGGGGGFYNKNHQPNNPNNNKHHSKLPHGLTVQELKEMTRARLAAEAEVGGPEGNGSSDLSVHSANTHGSSKGSADQFSVQGRGGSNESSSAAVTRNLVRDNESIRQRDYGNMGRPNSQGFVQGQPQMQQQQNVPPLPYNSYPRHNSPPFGPGPPPPPNQVNNGNGDPPPQGLPRQMSPPAFALNSSQTRSQGEAWEIASAASAEYPDPGFRSGAMPLMSPMRDSNAMRFNRGRCFSAGATAGVPSSSLFERQQHQAMMYYETSAPLTTGSTNMANNNRQRCATVSPPGMSRLHEDRPFLFSTDAKERLAIPPLSEPRLRIHSTGGLNTHLGGGAATSSAFVPIAGKQRPSGNQNDQFLPHSPAPLVVDRAKFNVNDRTISTGSAASGHGDLPSSMAEAVLSSITSTSGAPIGGTVIGHGASPFRASMTEREAVGDHSPFRAGMSENTSSAFRMDPLLPESAGTMPLFPSGEPAGGRNLFSSETSERMLLGTHSWGGAVEDEDGAHHANSLGLSHDFSNLLNLSSGPALRGRAATEPAWFGGIDPLLVSHIDPEHNGGAEMTKSGPPRVSSFVDTKNAPANFNGQQQNMSFEGFK